MAKVITRPCHSPSRAVVPVRGRAKRRQGCMWVGLLSDEIVCDSECRDRLLSRRQNRSDRSGEVREGSAASKNPSTHVRSKPGPGIPPRYHDALRRGRRSEGRSRSEDERRGGVGLGHSSDETSEQSVGATWRSWRSEGPGATGDAKERPGSEHRVGKPLGGLDAGPERSGTAVPEGCRHNRSEEPDALARTSGSVRGPSGNRRATATCARLTGQDQEVEVLYGKGNNQTMSFPEPCGRSREGAGEASAGVHVGRAIERRNCCDSECRDRLRSRRQNRSDRVGEVREGSAASKNPSTHVRSKPGPGIPPRYHDALRRGRRSEGRSRSEDERRGGVGLGHSSDETSEQSVGAPG